MQDQPRIALIIVYKCVYFQVQLRLAENDSSATSKDLSALALASFEAW